MLTLLLISHTRSGAGACSRVEAVSSDSRVGVQHGGRCARRHWPMEAFGTDVGRHPRMDQFSSDRPAARPTLSDAAHRETTRHHHAMKEKMMTMMKQKEEEIVSFLGTHCAQKSMEVSYFLVVVGAFTVQINEDTHRDHHCYM